MDEPLSNLDARLRVQMRAEVSRIQHELGATTIYVTHDQVVAMTMGDRVAVLRKGELQQNGGPEELYDHPANLFVASFIGSPAMNLLELSLGRRGDRLVLEAGDRELVLPPEVLARRPVLARYEGRRIGVGIRPEHLGSVGDARPGTALAGSVLMSESLGSERLVHVEVPVAPVSADVVVEVAGDVDRAAAADLVDEARARKATVLARFDTSFRPGLGDPIELAVPLERAHFFDLETSLALYA
jgi:multiple sugar transport system ATP-binding protein